MSQENVEIVRRAIEAFNRWGVRPPRRERNPESPLLDPEIEFHAYASVPEPGGYRGHEAVIEYQRGRLRSSSRASDRDRGAASGW